MPTATTRPGHARASRRIGLRRCVMRAVDRSGQQAKRAFRPWAPRRKRSAPSFMICRVAFAADSRFRRDPPIYPHARERGGRGSPSMQLRTVSLSNGCRAVGDPGPASTRPATAKRSQETSYTARSRTPAPTAINHRTSRWAPASGRRCFLGFPLRRCGAVAVAKQLRAPPSSARIGRVGHEPHASSHGNRREDAGFGQTVAGLPSLKWPKVQ
jgi:hypothetical protein